MNSNVARTALVGVLSVVIAVLLIALGFLGRVVVEGDPEVVREVIEITPTATAADTTTPADDTPVTISDIDPRLIEEIIQILEDDFVRARPHRPPDPV